MRLLPSMLVAALALAGVFGACGEGEEEIAPAPTTADATPAVTPTPAAATPTVSPALTTPESGTLTYVDPTHGYSFEYPADWFLDAPPVPPGAVGSGVVLTQWDTHKEPAPPWPNDYLKVDISTILNPDKLTAGDWLSAKGEAEGVTILSTAVAMLSGEAAVRQERVLHDTSTHLTMLIAVSGGLAYEIFAYQPPGSKMTPYLEAIISSFRFEQ